MRPTIEAGDWPLQAPGVAIFSVLVLVQRRVAMTEINAIVLCTLYSVNISLHTCPLVTRTGNGWRDPPGFPNSDTRSYIRCISQRQPTMLL